MARSFNNRLGLWVREDVVQDVFGPLKHHCRSFGVVLADTNKKGLDSGWAVEVSEEGPRPLPFYADQAGNRSFKP